MTDTPAKPQRRPRAVGVDRGVDAPEILGRDAVFAAGAASKRIGSPDDDSERDGHAKAITAATTQIALHEEGEAQCHVADMSATHADSRR